MPYEWFFLLRAAFSQLVLTHVLTCMHSFRGFLECMHPGMHACGNACTLKCMQPPPPRCKENGKFTKIPYSAAPNSKPPCTLDCFPCTPHIIDCAPCTPISPLCIHHLAHRWPRIAAENERAENTGWRARANDYEIMIPTLTPVLRFPTPPCLPSSVPPCLQASPPPLRHSFRAS